ncbi:MAG: serine/threonine-protein kinase [Terrimicrobiaceae bacterium]
MVGSAGQRYVMDESIGRGGLGEVFRAHDTQLNRWVAIKRLHQENTGGDSGKIMQEARHLAALQHPNIVTIYDFIEDRGDILVVMELLHGRTVQDIAENAPLLQQDFVRLMRQSLEGLIAAHALGMLHRDIKPSNLMVVDLPSGAFQVKILDFGLAKIVPEPSLQTTDQAGGLLGSVYTMSPEQLEGKPLDGRSDLYSLGCVGYFALTTYFPFTGATVPEVICAHLQQRVTPLRELRPDLPASLCDWLAGMMALHAENRPASAAVALQQLDAVLAGKSAPHPPRIAVAAKPPPPKKSPVALLAAIGLLVVAGAGASVFFLRNKPPSEKPAVVEKAKETALPILPDNKADFLQRVGQSVLVEGRIERAGVNKTGTIRFLNFAGTHRGDLTLVFFVKDAPAEFTPDRLSGYIGKTVRVRGQISTFEGAPQLVVSSLSQLETL